MWDPPGLVDIRIKSDRPLVARTGGVRTANGAYGRNIFKLVGIATSRNNDLQFIVGEMGILTVFKMSENQWDFNRFHWISEDLIPTPDAGATVNETAVLIYFERF